MTLAELSRRSAAPFRAVHAIACMTCVFCILVGCTNESTAPNSKSSRGPSDTAPTAEPETNQTARRDTPQKGIPRGNRELRIAAASDLQFALEEVQNEFEHLHPGATVTVKYGSSGSFFAQLANEAPFDMFLAADVEYARRLVEQGQGAPGSDFAYARGHIVVWAPNDSPRLVEQTGIETFREGKVQKIAIANPRTAPYGAAAVAALKSLGVYEAVEPKLVYGDNVAQTAQMVESGAADVGIIALSLAVSPRMRDHGRYWQVPESAYPPLVQGGVVLRWAQDAAVARDFRDFLLSGAGTSILKRFGFDEP